MKEILLLSEEKIEYLSISQKLEQSFPNINSDTKMFHYGKSPNSFNYYLTNDRLEERLYAFDNNELENIKLNNPYITDLEYHNKNISKKLIKILSDIYPNLYIVDVDNDWIGPVNHYLN